MSQIFPQTNTDNVLSGNYTLSEGLEVQSDKVSLKKDTKIEGNLTAGGIISSSTDITPGSASNYVFTADGNLLNKDLIGKSSYDGIPLYTLEYINSLSVLPSNYIITSTSNDLSGSVTNNNYAVSTNGNLVDILLASIRNLLSRLAKVENTFYYGLCSEDEGNTAKFNIISDSTEEESEPLWAIDPDLLETITDMQVSIGSDCSLTPSSNWTYSTDTNYVDISNEVATKELTGYDNSKYTAPKVICYSVIEPKNSNWTFHINISESSVIKIEELITLLKCSIMFIVSRRVTNSDNTTYNKNFYYLNITNANGDNIYSKYFDSSLNPVDLEQDVDSISVFNTISCSNLKLYRLNFYTKEQSFSNNSNIILDKPTTDDFIFKPAHITLRGVSTYSNMIKFKNVLLDKELIWCEDSDSTLSGLYIKYNGEIIPIGSTENSTTRTYIYFESSDLLLLIGVSKTFTASTNSTAIISYSSSDTSVATISSSGVINPIKAGTTTITASIAASGNYTAKNATCVLTVTSESGDSGESGNDNPDTPSSNWTFGGTFPITLSGSSEEQVTSFSFGDPFPITLN